MCAVVVAGGFSPIWNLASVLACAGAGIYLLTLVLKVESLKFLDSAVFFPLYKVLGPSIAILFGLVIFNESFSTNEWVGLALGVTIPLLLVSRAEEQRQKDIYRGLLMVVLAALAGSISIALFKTGAELTDNVWQYVLISEVFLFVSSAAKPYRQHGTKTLRYILSEVKASSVLLVLIMGAAQVISTTAIIFSFSMQGELGIVYTINSLYILVPIALSKIVYGEHLGPRKVLAIALSVLTVGLLG